MDSKILDSATEVQRKIYNSNLPYKKYILTSGGTVVTKDNSFCYGNLYFDNRNPENMIEGLNIKGYSIHLVSSEELDKNEPTI